MKKKTKIIVNDETEDTTEIIVNNKPLHSVNYLKYVGSIISDS